jgi:hypothetical protein
MFKRIRTYKGDTLNITLQMPEGFKRIVRAQIVKGSGAPVARLQMTQANAGGLVLSLATDASARMQGVYKYEIAVEADMGITTIQNGFLEVL